KNPRGDAVPIVDAFQIGSAGVGNSLDGSRSHAPSFHKIRESLSIPLGGREALAARELAIIPKTLALVFAAILGGTGNPRSGPAALRWAKPDEASLAEPLPVRLIALVRLQSIPLANFAQVRHVQPPDSFHELSMKYIGE